MIINIKNTPSAQNPQDLVLDQLDAKLLEQQGAGSNSHLSLDGDADFTNLDLTDVQAVTIQFPAFTDGRGFSLAMKIRQSGFTGTLCAKGPLIPDQAVHLMRCGFDHIDLDRHERLDAFYRSLKRYSHFYQGGRPSPTGEAKSILELRHRGQKAAS